MNWVKTMNKRIISDSGKCNEEKEKRVWVMGSVGGEETLWIEGSGKASQRR